MPDLRLDQAQVKGPDRSRWSYVCRQTLVLGALRAISKDVTEN